jgi:hypothetical protein
MQATTDAKNGGRAFDERRFYTSDNELVHHSERTYAFTNQWGRRTSEAMDRIVEAFPNEEISYRESAESNS